MRSDRKEDLVPAALLLGGVVIYVLGFTRGWRRGQIQLLLGLERALRIQKHLNKE